MSPETKLSPATTTSVAEPVAAVIVKPWYARYRRRMRAAVIWGGFFGLLWWLRSFFSLIFLTFIASFTIASLIRFFERSLPWKRWAIIMLVYGLVLTTFTAMGMTIFPQIYKEGRELAETLPAAKEKLMTSVRSILDDPSYAKIFEGVNIEETVRDQLSPIISGITSFLQSLARISFHFLLSLIFSFLILWDLERFRREVKSLEYTRLRPFYRVLAVPLSHYGDILGKAFEAQIVIAAANTLLTLIGLTFLGIPSKLFLSMLVFICSFIPVLGVIISSVPICLLAFKNDGVLLAAYAGMLIAIIHFIEAYFLNPRIVGAHLSLHPFVAVSILVVSEYFFGVWGLLLGVPTSVFLFQYLIELPPRPPDERPEVKPLQPSQCHGAE